MRIFMVFKGFLLVTGLMASLTGVDPADAGTEAAPDLVIVNGNIITVDAALPRVAAVAVRGGLILALGSNAAMAALKGPETETLDLSGATLIPGFIEAHAHLLYLGRAQQELQLTGATTWSEVVAIVAQAAENKASGEWIIGSGWHQEKWREAPEPAVESYPTHQALSRASPDNPVLLYHASGHAALANARAMQAAGLDADTPAISPVLQNWASSPPCSRSTPPRTAPGWKTGSAPGAPPKAPTSGAACSIAGRRSP